MPVLTFGFTIQKKIEWPPLPEDAIAVGSDIIVQTLGDEIKVFNKNSLLFLNGISIDTKRNIHAVEISKETKTIYAAAAESGIYIIDYSNINNLKIINQIKDYPNDPGYLMGKERGYINAAGLFIDNDILYIADNGYGLRMFNVQNHLNPVYLGGYREDGKSENLTTGGYFDVAFFSYNSKKYAAILDLYYGLRVFDVTEPSQYNNPVEDKKNREEKDPAPVMLKKLTSTFYNQIALVQDIKINFSNSVPFAYLTDRSATKEQAAVFKIKLFDSNKNPIAEPVNLGRSDELIKGNSLEIDNGKAFIADGNNGLKIVDMETAHGTTEENVEIYKVISSFNSDFNYSYSLKFHENKIYIADLDKGLTSINVSSVSNPFQEKNTGDFFSMESLAKSGEIIGLVSKNSNIAGFYFFNVENKSEIELLTKINESNPLFIRPYKDSFAGVTNSSLIKFSKNGNDFSTEKKVLLGGSPTSFFTWSDYLYIGTSNEIIIYKYDLGNFSEISKIAVQSEITAITTDSSGKFLFAGSKNGRVLIFNMENKSSLVLENYSPQMSGEIKALAFENNILYSGYSDKITTINTDTSAIITTIDDEKDNLLINSISVDKNVLFAGMNKGIKIYSNSNTDNPSFITMHSNKGNVKEIYAGEDHLYSADSSSGISISEYDKNAGSQPEPFEPSSGESSSCFINSLF